MEKNNKIFITLIIVLSVTVLGLGGFIVYDKVLKENNKQDTNNNETDNNNKYDKLFENDNRIRPLTMYFYDEKFGSCFETEDGECLNVYKDQGEYKSASWGKLTNDYYGKYVCESSNCDDFMANPYEKVALIDDNGLVLYDYANNKKIDTEMNVINAWFLNKYSSNYYVRVSNEEKKYNVLNVNNKEYVLDTWYDEFNNDYGSILLTYVENSDKTDIYENYKKVDSIKGNYNQAYQYENYVILGNENWALLDKNFKLLKKFEKTSELKIIKDYIIAINYNKNYDSDINHFMSVYDLNSLNLVKKVEKTACLEKIEINDKTLYFGSALCDHSDPDSAVYSNIFDEDLNILINESKIPTNLTDTDFKGLFNIKVESDTLKIITDKEYTFDLKGNLLN